MRISATTIGEDVRQARPVVGHDVKLRGRRRLRAVRAQRARVCSGPNRCCAGASPASPAQRAAVPNSACHGSSGASPGPRYQRAIRRHPVDRQHGRRHRIGCCEGAGLHRRPRRIVDREHHPGRSVALDFPENLRLHGLARPTDHKEDARRSAVDGENALVRAFHHRSRQLLRTRGRHARRPTGARTAVTVSVVPVHRVGLAKAPLEATAGMPARPACRAAANRNQLRCPV